jgi:hypothetical protein
MATLALACCALCLALAFGLRTLLQLRRTGSTGFHGIGGRSGSAEWFAGVLFTVAIIVGVAAPVLALTEAAKPLDALDARVAHIVGTILFAAGLCATLAAQLAMGSSCSWSRAGWRSPASSRLSLRSSCRSAWSRSHTSNAPKVSDTATTPRASGASSPASVDCLDATGKLAELRGEKANPKRETWRLFRELWQPKWSEAFRATIAELTGGVDDYQRAIVALQVMGADVRRSRVRRPAGHAAARR